MTTDKEIFHMFDSDFRKTFIKNFDGTKDTEASVCVACETLQQLMNTFRFI